MKFYILILSIIIGYASVSAYPIVNSVYTINGQAQGTTYSIKYYADVELVSKRQIDSIFKVIDESMSVYNPNSLITRFNQPTTKKVKINAHMYNVMRASLDCHKRTNGYFDVTVFPLIKLWGFGPAGFKSNPTLSEIDSVRQFVGADKLVLKKHSLKKKNKGLSIDLNGIAQGYTVDVIGNYLKQKGIKSFMVEVGGEIYCEGVKPSGDPYKIEIQRPYSDTSNTFKIALKNKAITTSGNYEKVRVYEGQNISHHINPLTGRPVTNQTISATIIANTAMEADALDNYLMYLKPKEAIEFIEKNPSIEAYIIYYENNKLKELQSSGFNNYIYN